LSKNLLEHGLRRGAKRTFEISKFDYHHRCRSGTATVTNLSDGLPVCDVRRARDRDIGLGQEFMSND
jgi:hypothetical protein